MLYIVDMTLGKNIARRRIELDLTQDELAQACGVSSQAVSQWENDITVPETEKIPLIAKKLDMTLGWPFNGSGSPTTALPYDIWDRMTPDQRKQALRILEALLAA